MSRPVALRVAGVLGVAVVGFRQRGTPGYLFLYPSPPCTASASSMASIQLPQSHATVAKHCFVLRQLCLLAATWRSRRLSGVTGWQQQVTWGVTWHVAAANGQQCAR